MSELNIMQANTSIELKCDWDGNFILKEANGKMWHYSREEWVDVQKHMQSLIRPPSGDPK